MARLNATLLLTGTLLALAIVLATAITPALAQDFIKEYNTRPAFSCAFDTDPKSTMIAPYTTLQAAGSAFEYTYGAGSHTGVISFDGRQDYLDFNRFYDDNGVNFTANMYGEEMSFEVWASWTELRSWSRLFDFGKGLGDTNIFLGNGWTGSTITFNAMNGTSQTSTIYADNAVSLYNWQHVVGTVRKNPSATSVATGAILSIYVNGVLLQSGTGFLPPVTRRQSSWLGRSNWEAWGDQRFRGLFDDFFVYNYTLSSEAIAAHYIVPRIAIFEHTFSADPATMVASGSSSLNYGWLSADPSSTVHAGLLTLSGSQYLKLDAYDGANAIGTIMPSLGGTGWGFADNDTAGWTFEAAFKLTSAVVTSSCLYDVSNAGADRIALCFSSSTTLQFSISNALKSGGTPGTIDVLTSVQVNTWYHVVVNVQVFDASTNVARYEVYVNGRYANSANNGVWPRSVTRDSPYVGRSYAGQMMVGYIDSLRFYDYSLTVSEMRQLYGAVTYTVVSGPSPLYSTTPTVSHTFDVSVPWGVRNGGTKLGWLSQVSSRPGILSLLSTDTQYVNLLTLPDRNYNLLSGYIGARSMTFEFWVMWNVFNSWQRVIDLSATALSGSDPLDNIFLATWTTTDTTQAATMVFSADGGPTGSIDSRIQLNNAVYLNTWYHVVCTIKTDRTQNPNSTTSAQLQLYINGELRAVQSSTTPRYVNRPNSWLGRSRYSADGYFGGYIDAFHYYDYALEAEQVRAHYAVPRPPQFELTFASTPSQLPGMNATNNFGWVSSEPGASATSQANHPGLLALTAASQHYIDLTVSSGTTTIGALMPPLGILGDGHLVGSTYEFAPGQATSRYGMSFEVSFKYSSASGANAKLFSCGATEAVDEVEIGFVSGSRDLTFTLHNSEVGRTESIVLVANAVTTRWYHVVVALNTDSSSTLYQSSWTVYVDGVQTATSANRVFPYATLRDYCVLGRDATAASDSYLDGYIDVFRVYDYVLNSTEVATIVSLISPNSDSSSSSSSSSTGAYCPTTPDEAAASSSSSSSLSGGAIAGIVIACIVGVVVIAALFLVFLRSSKGGTGAMRGGGGGGGGKNAHVELSEASEVRHDEHEQESA